MWPEGEHEIRGKILPLKKGKENIFPVCYVDIAAVGFARGFNFPKLSTSSLFIQTVHEITQRHKWNNWKPNRVMHRVFRVITPIITKMCLRIFLKDMHQIRALACKPLRSQPYQNFQSRLLPAFVGDSTKLGCIGHMLFGSYLPYFDFFYIFDIIVQWI